MRLTCQSESNIFSILFGLKQFELSGLMSTLYVSWQPMMMILIPYTWHQGYKTFILLNSTEHKISNAHKN